MVTILPWVNINGEWYVIDAQLGEIRPGDRPWENEKLPAATIKQLTEFSEENWWVRRTSNGEFKARF